MLQVYMHDWQDGINDMALIDCCFHGEWNRFQLNGYF